MSSIVVIEDDGLMRQLLKEWLTAAGYCVRDGTSGAMPRAEADLVIVNLSQPRQAGSELVRAVRQAHAEIPIIAISAQFRRGLGSSSEVARSLGVRGLIPKPFTREDLLEAVRRLIGTP